MSKVRLVLSHLAILTTLYIGIGCQCWGEDLKKDDPLPSWNKGPIKEKIVNFVQSTTSPESSGYVKPEDRVAVFDLDGTLMAEWPVNFQRSLAVKRLKEIAKGIPVLREQQPYKSAWEDDGDYYNLKKNHSYVFLTAFRNTTQGTYHHFIESFLNNEKDDYWGVTFDQLLYKPGLELVSYLQDNGFQVYICSTTEESCIRILLKKAVGLDHYQVIGNEVEKQFDFDEHNDFVLSHGFRTPENRSQHKCTYFHHRVAKKPIFGFGNTMGDACMLKMVSANKPHLVLILDHDDPEREIEYHDDGLLEEARKGEWEVISMKRDFKRVFPVEIKERGKSFPLNKYMGQ